MVFLNKLDRAGASLKASMESILDHRIHPKPLLLTMPVASFDGSHYKSGEPGIEGVVDLVRWEVWRWYPSHESTFAAAERVEKFPLPRDIDALHRSSIFSPNHPLVPELIAARTALIDEACSSSSSLMNELVDLPEVPSPYLTVSDDALIAALRAASLRQSVLPIVTGAALKHIGTELLMDFVGLLAPSPEDVRKALIPFSRQKLDLVKVEDLQILAWKVSWDKRKGWITFVRVYSGTSAPLGYRNCRLTTTLHLGTLRSQTALRNVTNDAKERVSKVMLLYASQPEEVEYLAFGSVGAVLGFRHTRTGDTLVSSSLKEDASSLMLAAISPPPAVISASIVPQSHTDVKDLEEALTALTRCDPSIRITEDSTEGQTLVHGLGALHLEIAENRLRDEWGINAHFGKRRVAFRETIAPDSPPVSEIGRCNKDVAHKKVEATVNVTLRPMDREEVVRSHAAQHIELWDGNLVQVVIDDSTIEFPPPDSTIFDHHTYPAHSPIVAILQGVTTALSSSPHTLLPLSKVHLRVDTHTLDIGAPPTLLISATSEAIRHALQRSNRYPLMEPYARVKVDVDEGNLGNVVKDLTEHGGEILDLGMASGMADDEIGPFKSEGVYIPSDILTPSSAAQRATGGSSSMKRTVHANAPLAQMLDYASRLRAVSGGQGSFELSVAGFHVVSTARRAEILREIGRL